MKQLFYYIALMAVVLMSACASDETTDNEQPLPEGMGRIRIAISTPENVMTGGQSSTRAVNVVPWEDPDHEWERLNTFRIIICSMNDNKVVQIITGTKDQLTEVTHTENASDTPVELEEGSSNTTPSSMSSTHKWGIISSRPLRKGKYYIYATANYADGYVEGTSTFNLDRQEVFPNSTGFFVYGNDASYTNVASIPMTGKLTTPDGSTMREVEVINGMTTDVTDTPLAVWRVMGKMQFEFTNESATDIRIVGVEVEPIHKPVTDHGIYLFSKDDLTSIANLAPTTGITLPTTSRNDTASVAFPPLVANQYLTLSAKNDGSTDEGKIYFYVNETSATFTTSLNQLSLRFKLQRKKDNDTWYDEEIRYGVTTQHDGTNSGAYGGYNGGFNVIRRNDWIHIPVTLTDWQLRIEPLALVPIAGYPAKTLSSDGLTATFSTGGRIILQPFVKKYDDTSWRDFSDPLITWWDEHEVKESDNTTPDEAASWDASIHWKNADGTNVSGDGKIIKTPFTFDEVNHCIVGELNQAKVGSNAKTTITLDVKLGDYKYSFTFNIVLQ